MARTAESSGHSSNLPRARVASLAAVTAAAALSVAFLATGVPVSAQVTPRRDPPPRLAAVRVVGDEPRIDGVLDEAGWEKAAVASNFIQYRPMPGAPATHATEARVLYGEDALFVAIRAFDPAPDSIVADLTRRDGDQRSDRVGVLVDSYMDRRTAFQFTVNPRGVKTDMLRHDDVEEDSRWDPVWEVATQVDREGWTAEFRIPYSQLRFAEAPRLTWGIQFHRDIARLDELSLWAPTLPSDGAVVSLFGGLEGLEGLGAPRRLELLPYALSRLREGAAPRDPGAREAGGMVGGDLKYGLGSGFTLDLTVNPDFGQVEADPARVNLTAFENFYPERRPFFQEASNLFDFPVSLSEDDDDLEMVFYSRRIGRSPRGFSAGDPRFTSPVRQTTILGAAKLSGRTANGWSVGVASALTAGASAEVALGSGASAVPVEPRSSYTVARVIRDLRQGRTAIGFIGTAVAQERGGADVLRLPTSALAGGVDFRHRFSGDRYQLQGWMLSSVVRGSAPALEAVQRSPVHLFQRPGAEHLTLDPSLTMLSGTASNLRIHRVSGGPWRGGAGFQHRSPGFDVGEAGFQRMSDLRVGYVEVGYERSEPQGQLRSWEAYSTHWGAWTGGSERLERGGNLRGEFLLRNLWGGWFGVEYSLEGMSPALLRGGPGLLREAEIMGWAGLFTDARRGVRGRLETSWSARPESGSWGWRAAPSVTWRPTPVADVRVGPVVSVQVEDRQWIGATGGDDPVYVFGRMRHHTLGATFAADLAFSPTLSLQIYAQPFVSAGTFEDFGTVADPGAARYRDRFATLSVARDTDGRLSADLDRDGVAEVYDNPDFNFRRLRTNTVLRWEYRPGSTLFLVWSQGREDVALDGSFRPRHDLGRLFAARSDDAFILKASYWWAP